MNAVQAATLVGERLPLPDVVTRAAIAALVARTDRRLAAAPPGAEARFATDMAAYPIAVHTGAANAQHYEIPAAFFELVLGPQRKYSCCLYDDGARSLAEAEEAALAATAANAALADGQRILELGCGWGSLSLWMARQFPGSTIVSVSNSQSQRAFVEGQAAARGLSNLTVVTADMNDFCAAGRFDRVVSVEMFEHMANWRPLLTRIRDWLEADGRLFLHVFSHRAAPYRFETDDPDDWIARHFFTGGIMPSHGLARQFGDVFAVEFETRWNGRNYARTADAWLENQDARRDEALAILRGVYGAEARLWLRRWRLFFLATSGLFGHDDGRAWGVSHYRLAPARQGGGFQGVARPSQPEMARVAK